ncbi:MAG TPA: hypothetical protein VER37_06410, partial [Thermomicrobiales bacterium]|nr:hypothetical protein [Thermomicrobiales bacterium]
MGVVQSVREQFAGKIINIDGYSVPLRKTTAGSARSASPDSGSVGPGAIGNGPLEPGALERLPSGDRQFIVSVG